jgi:hypothetical protein
MRAYPALQTSAAPIGLESMRAHQLDLLSCFLNLLHVE